MSELRQKIKALLLRELGEKAKSNSRGRALVVGGAKKRKGVTKGRKLRKSQSVDIMELMGGRRRSKSRSMSKGRALSVHRRKSRSKSHSRGRALSVHRRKSRSLSKGRALYKKSYSAYNGLGSALVAGKRSKSRSKSRGKPRKVNSALKMIVKIAQDLKKQDGGRKEWKEYISMAGKEYRREKH